MPSRKRNSRRGRKSSNANNNRAPSNPQEPPIPAVIRNPLYHVPFNGMNGVVPVNHMNGVVPDNHMNGVVPDNHMNGVVLDNHMKRLLHLNHMDGDVPVIHVDARHSNLGHSSDDEIHELFLPKGYDGYRPTLEELLADPVYEVLNKAVNDNISLHLEFIGK